MVHPNIAKPELGGHHSLDNADDSTMSVATSQVTETASLHTASFSADPNDIPDLPSNAMAYTGQFDMVVDATSAAMLAKAGSNMAPVFQRAIAVATGVDRSHISIISVTFNGRAVSLSPHIEVGQAALRVECDMFAPTQPIIDVATLKSSIQSDASAALSIPMTIFGDVAASVVEDDSISVRSNSSTSFGA
jgi:hypothetical protein